MGKTMKWPPVPVNGRIPYVSGVDSSTVLVVQTLSDLQTNPFNPDQLSLGEVAFKSRDVAEARISASLSRLSPIIQVDRVLRTTSTADELEGKVTYEIEFIDRETRQPSKVNVNG